MAIGEQEMLENYKLITENANDLIRVLNDKLEIEYINETAHLEILGYAKDELIGKVGAIPFHPEEYLETRHFLRKLFKTGQAMRTGRIQHKNGNWIWIEIKGKAFKDSYGNQKALMISRDVTERKQAEDELKRFKNISDNANYGIGMIDLDGILTYVNKYFATIHGYEPDEITGKNFSILHNDDQLKRIQELKEKLEVEGSYNSEEVWHIHKNGSIFPTLMNGVSIKNEKGEFFLAATVIDISDQYEAKQKSKESEEMFRNLTEQSFMGIAIVQDDRISYANQAILDIFGYSLDEVKSWQPLELLKLFPPKDREFILGQGRKQPDGYDSSIHNYKVQFLKKNGESGWLDLFSNPINYKGRLGIMVSIIDITDKMKAEQNLKESEEKYRGFVNNISDVIFELDINGICSYVSHQLLGISGFSPEEMIGQNVFKFVHPDDLIKVAEEVKIAFNSNDNRYIEFRLRHKDGRYVPVSSRFSSISIGEKQKLTGVIVDITERKKAEEDLLRENDFTETALNAQRDTFFVFDPYTGKAIRWNKAFRDASGYSDEEISSMKAPDSYYSEEDLKRAAEAILQIETSAETTVEMDLINKDGSSIPFEYIGSSIKDEYGNLKYIVSIGRDITERKKIEEALYQERDLIHMLLENHPDFIYFKDRNAQFQHLSKSFCEFLGRNTDDIVGRTDFELFPGEVAKQTYSEDLQVIRTGTPLINKEESARGTWVLTTKIPWLDKEGNIKGLFGISKDITERKNAEQKLKESEEKYKALSTELEIILDNVPAIIYSISKDDIILRVNQYLATALNLNKEDIIGKSSIDLFPIDQAERYRKDDLEVISSGKPKLLIEEPWNTPNGLRWALTSKIPNYDDKEDVTGVIGISIDITERKEAEQKLKESEEKYRILVEKSIQGIAIIQDLRVVFANSAFAKILGYSIEDILTMSTEDLVKMIHPDDRELVLNRHKKRMEGRLVPDRYEYRIIRKDKKVRYVEISATVIEYKGRVASQQSFIDITDRKEAEEKLKESEEKFRTITEESHLAISIMQDDIVKYTNQKMADLTGYSIEEILSWQPGEFSKVVASDSLEMVMEQVKKKQAGELDVVIHYPIHVNKKSGDLVWADNMSKTIIYEGRPADLVTQIDITEQKEAEQKLKESEEKFRTITEQSFMGIAILQDRIVKYCNKKFVDIFGYTVDDFLKGKPGDFNNVIHPDDRDMVKEQGRKKQMGEPDYITFYQYRGIKKTGEVLWLDIFSKTILYEGKSANFVTLLDITEKKKAEQKLKESEEKFRRIFEAIPDMFFLVSSEGKILEYRAKEKDLYAPSSTIIGRNIKNVLPKNVSNIAMNAIKETLNTKQPSLMEYSLTLRNQLRYYEGRLLYFSDDRIAVFIRDITEKKQAEMLILEENKKLAELNKIKQNLITRVSHELKTPLNSVHGAAHLLMTFYKEQMNETVLEYTDLIYKGSLRLKRLIEDLLNISKIDHDKFELIKKTDNISDIIYSCVDQLKYMLIQRNLHLNVDLPKELFLKVDRLRIEQVITNILSNAIKFTPPEGSITITSKQHNEYTDILIKDTGIGLTENEKKSLFTKFGKIERYGQNLDVDIEGSGLGLYISKQIVDLHGGEIFVESKGRNRGSTFIIRLYKDS